MLSLHTLLLLSLPYILQMFLLCMSLILVMSIHQPCLFPMFTRFSNSLIIFYRSSPNLFPEESPTSMSKHANLVSESPPPISDVPSHASDKLPTPIIDVPTDTAPAVDPTSPSDSHALRLSHRVTTLLSHLRDFHCFSTLAYL